MSEEHTPTVEELDELRTHNAQLEAMVEALQARELELSRELIKYQRMELSQLRASE